MQMVRAERLRQLSGNAATELERDMYRGLRCWKRHAARISAWNHHALACIVGGHASTVHLRATTHATDLVLVTSWHACRSMFSRSVVRLRRALHAWHEVHKACGYTPLAVMAGNYAQQAKAFDRWLCMLVDCCWHARQAFVLSACTECNTRSSRRQLRVALATALRLK